MTNEGHAESLEADYRDTPRSRGLNPLIRLFLIAGGIVPMIMPGVILVLAKLGFDPEVLLICGIVSVAGTPVIYLFWSTKIEWRGGRLASYFQALVATIFTWVGGMLVSVIAVISFGLIVDW